MVSSLVMLINVIQFIRTLCFCHISRAEYIWWWLPNKPAVSNLSQYWVGHCPGPRGNKKWVRVVSALQVCMFQGQGLVAGGNHLAQAWGTELGLSSLTLVFLVCCLPHLLVHRTNQQQAEFMWFMWMESPAPQLPLFGLLHWQGKPGIIRSETSGHVLLLSLIPPWPAGMVPSWLCGWPGSCRWPKVMGLFKLFKAKTYGAFQGISLTNLQKYSPMTDLGT